MFYRNNDPKERDRKHKASNVGAHLACLTILREASVSGERQTRGKVMGNDGRAGQVRRANP